jgi:thiol-disulfide isomerase/thioredoxin
MKNRKFTITTLLFVASLLYLFCTPSFAALKLNDAAPAFFLSDARGKDVALNDVLNTAKNGKVNGVIVSFFASWCAPCRLELPLLNSLAEELKGKGIVIVLVDVKEDFDTIHALLAELKVNKPVVLSDRSGKTAESYQVRFLPTTFFIGHDGKVKDMIFGEIKNETALRQGAGKLVQ